MIDWPDSSADAEDYSADRLIREGLAYERWLHDPWRKQLTAALADVRRALGAEKTSERPPLFDDGIDLLQREFHKPAWLVDRLITRGGVTIIGAEPKAAKTWLGTEIALAIATGTQVCGEFFASAGRVAYFYAEDLDRQIRNRMRALLMGRSAVLAPGRFFPCPRGKSIDITRDDDLAWLVASCRRLGSVDLLVLDPLRDISSAAEDKSDEMAPVMRRLRVVADLLGCTVAVVHHASKGTKDTSKRRPGQNLRGSGAIHGAIDSGIYLSDLDGDGANVFRNLVDCELRAARSAGRFMLEMTVIDDELGEAVRATWKVSRDDVPARKRSDTAAKAKREQEQNDKVLAFVRDLAIRGVHLSERQLRDHDGAPYSDQPMRRVLSRLRDVGQLERRSGLVHIPKPKQEFES